MIPAQPYSKVVLDVSSTASVRVECVACLWTVTMLCAFWELGTVRGEEQAAGMCCMLARHERTGKVRKEQQGGQDRKGQRRGAERWERERGEDGVGNSPSPLQEQEAGVVRAKKGKRFVTHYRFGDPFRTRLHVHHSHRSHCCSAHQPVLLAPTRGLQEVRGHPPTRGLQEVRGHQRAQEVRGRQRACRK